MRRDTPIAGPLVVKAFKDRELKALQMILDSGIEFIELGLNKKDLGDLKDVYFNARYPGENYIAVNYEDCADYIKTMYDVVLAINTYRQSRGLPVKHVTPKQLNNSESLDSIDNVL